MAHDEDHGKLKQISPEWREQVKARLVELNQTPAWLAGQTGATRATLFAILDGKTLYSKHLDAINVALWPDGKPPLDS